MFMLDIFFFFSRNQFGKLLLSCEEFQIELHKGKSDKVKLSEF